MEKQQVIQQNLNGQDKINEKKSYVHMNCKPKHRPNKPNSTKTPDSARQINQTTSNSSGEQVGAGGSRRQSQQQQQQLQLQHHQRSVNASGLRRLVVLIQCDRSVWQLMPTV